MRTMLTIEQAIEQYDGYANVCMCHNLTVSQKEFEQLATWLRELQDRRKAPEIIRCGECTYREIRGVDGFCDHITGEPIMVKKTDHCSWAERRTDD